MQLHTPPPIKGGRRKKVQEISFLGNATVFRKGAWASEEKPARQMLPYSVDQFVLSNLEELGFLQRGQSD